MAQCPRCKEDMPLLSRICPVCGYVAEGDGSEPTAEEFANVLEKCLYEIKAIPEPTFSMSMAQLSFIMLPLIALYLLLVAVISEAGLFWILFAVFALLSIWVLIKKMRGNLGNDPFNRRFKELKNNYELNERIAKRSFGKNREVAKLLSEISAQISDIEVRRNAAGRKNLLIWIIILVVCIILASAGVFSVDKAMNTDGKGEDKITQLDSSPVSEEWQKALELFKASANDEYKAEEERLEIVMTILNAGKEKAAEDFFIEYCMGKRGDFNCAEKIILYYVDNNKSDSAKVFLDRCTGLKYKSDKRKLEKLIK